MRIIGNDPSTPRQAQIVASGTLSTGDAVVVNSDGTVSAVEISTSSQALGTAVTFKTGTSADNIAAAYDPNAQKVVIAYQDGNNSNYGTAVVGTVSGTSISFGTAVVFFSGAAEWMSIAYEATAQKMVISFEDTDSAFTKAIVGTVSGTSISFGTAVVFAAVTSKYTSTVYDPDNQKIIIAYQDDSNSDVGKAVVGTVSGTSISFGSIATFNSSTTNFISATYDTNADKVVVAYKDSDSRGKAIVGTVSGTSISFGSEVQFEVGSTSDIACAFDDTANKVIIAYADDGNSGSGTAIVGTVSGTSISFGSASVFDAKCAGTSVVYNPAANKTVISYYDSGNSFYGTLVVATVSGTSISFDTPVVFNEADTGDLVGSAYDSTTKQVVLAYEGAKSRVFRAAYNEPNLTAENYIGTAATGAPSGTGAKINLKGAVDENQSGLTAGQSYYVQTDGTLGTTPADPSVFAGTAVAANKLIVKG